jgi:hypothetical protein
MQRDPVKALLVLDTLTGRAETPETKLVASILYYRNGGETSVLWNKA